MILAGAVCDFRLGYGRVLPRKGKVIAINRNKVALNDLIFCHTYPSLGPRHFTHDGRAIPVILQS